MRGAQPAALGDNRNPIITKHETGTHDNLGEEGRISFELL